MTNPDFVAAATRHLHDARILNEKVCCDNAVYLAGYVAECALKAVVERSGLTAQLFGHKLAKLEGDGLDLAVAMLPASARYRPPASAVRAINSAWSPSLRYSPSQAGMVQSLGLVEAAAEIWTSCIGEMLLDGVILELPMMVEITFDTALQEVVAAVQKTGLDLAGCELTLLRDLAGRIRLHAACPTGQRWPAGSRETLKTALRAAQPYHTEVVYLEILGEGSREFPLTDRLVSERQPYDVGERTENSPAWFRFERRFSKDSWLQETGRPQEPWPLENAPVVVSFFGFKGGVGRTSALAAFALHLADQGKNVAAVDLDLEAPGLASLLLGEEIPTDLGVVDFLVEERLDRSSPLALSRFYLSSPHVEGNGSLRVFPAGRLNENYVEKLGRIDIQGLAEPEFSARSLLRRLLGRIRDEVRPDAILLDVRAGLHDLGGISLAGLSHLELIFAVHSAQSWEGLPLVLRHLGRLRSDWVKLVHTLVPSLGRGGDEAHGEFVSRAYELCSEYYYLEGDLPGPEDETATHHAYRLPFREALMGLSDLHRSRADLLADEHRLFCEQLARDVGLGD